MNKKLKMSPLQQHNHKGWSLIAVVSMAFVINVIKWLMWTVETIIILAVFYSVLVRNTCQHSQQIRLWPNAGPPSATLAQHQTSTGSTPGVCWELRSAGLLLLNTAGDDYKPTQTQWLLNVGPSVAGAGQYPFSPSQYFMLMYLHVF